MTYSVKEVFYTLQGEGANAGRAAVFCRFAGCNLWSGREEDRATAQCRFCDTEFVGTDGTAGGKYKSADDLAAMVERHWPSADTAHRLVVLTGGEPTLHPIPTSHYRRMMNYPHHCSTAAKVRRVRQRVLTAETARWKTGCRQQRRATGTGRMKLLGCATRS